MKEYKAFFEKLNLEKSQFEQKNNAYDIENGELKAEIRRATGALATSKEENAKLTNERSELLKKVELLENLKVQAKEAAQSFEKLSFEQKTKISALTSEIDVLRHYVENQGVINSEVF